jgi:hypothetical protein
VTIERGFRDVELAAKAAVVILPRAALEHRRERLQDLEATPPG